LKDVTLGATMESVIDRVSLAVKEEFNYAIVEVVGEFDDEVFVMSKI